MSWNTCYASSEMGWRKSASLWGCELKYRTNFSFFGEYSVSLLVRLWVEIFLQVQEDDQNARQPPCEAVSWNTSRMKVAHRKLSSASLWGCELKCSLSAYRSPFYCQPPCEAVSWNNCLRISRVFVVLSASLWGCELKLCGKAFNG